MTMPNRRDYDTQEEYDEAFDKWLAYLDHLNDEDDRCLKKPN
jgi:hypothetical protein